MSYSIQYGPITPVKNKKQKKNGILPLIATVILPAVLLTVWKQSKSAKDGDFILFPWEETYVQEAFSVFSSSVKEGESFIDAASLLYQQLLQGDHCADGP